MKGVPDDKKIIELVDVAAADISFLYSMPYGI